MGITEKERNERISKSISYAEAVGGQDIVSFFKMLRTRFYVQRDSRTHIRRSTSFAPPTRSRESPLRLAHLSNVNESQILRDPRYLANARALLLPLDTEAKRIVGGIAVESSEFLDCVAIGDDGENPWKCSGTLITSDTVLTAGHCKDCSKRDRFVPTRVFFGKKVDVKGEVFDVDEIIRHPEYNTKTDANDLMILVLKKKVPSKIAKPRPLATTKLIDRATKVRLVGFGSNDELAHSGYGIKRQAEVAIASNSCQGCVDGKRDARYYGCFPGLELVAGRPALMRDTCKGDSGGPVYVYDGRKKWLLACVTSRATRDPRKTTICGDGGIYARVDKYCDWIESVTGISRKKN
jgi:secreted trypsin-like serine protease